MQLFLASMLPVSAISDANPYYIITGACCVLAVLVCIHFARDHDSEEWKASSLRRVADGEDSKKLQPLIETNAASTSAFQRFMESTLVEFWMHPFLGFFVPVALIYLLVAQHLDGAPYEVAAVFGGVFLWNTAFRIVFKFPLRLPVLPIPIAWAAMPLLLIGLWHWVASG